MTIRIPPPTDEQGVPTVCTPEIPNIYALDHPDSKLIRDNHPNWPSGKSVSWECLNCGLFFGIDLGTGKDFSTK